MARGRKSTGELDTELEDLPAPMRWREWMGRVEAVIFAAAEPVLRESLTRVVGTACNLELIIDDIRDELRGLQRDNLDGKVATIGRAILAVAAG